eukprot:7382064-Prymnesium_polylepis.1
MLDGGRMPSACSSVGAESTIETGHVSLPGVKQGGGSAGRRRARPAREQPRREKALAWGAGWGRSSYRPAGTPGACSSHCTAISPVVKPPWPLPYRTSRPGKTSAPRPPRFRHSAGGSWPVSGDGATRRGLWSGGPWFRSAHGARRLVEHARLAQRAQQVAHDPVDLAHEPDVRRVRVATSMAALVEQVDVEPREGVALARQRRDERRGELRLHGEALVAVAATRSAHRRRAASRRVRKAGRGRRSRGRMFAGKHALPWHARVATVRTHPHAMSTDALSASAGWSRWPRGGHE